MNEEEIKLRDEAYGRLRIWRDGCREIHDRAKESRNILLLQDPTLQVTKEVYPAIAKEYGTSNLAVEKAIRAVIEVAWENRNDSLWRQYFPLAPTGQIPRPTAGQFLTRLADAVGSVVRKQA